MKRATTLLSALALLAIAQPANAQGMRPFDPVGAARPQVFDSSGDWERCVNEDHEHPLDRAFESCARLIDNRDSTRSLRAAALWYRAMLHFDQQDAELAHGDLAQALELYSALVQANPREASAYSNRASVNHRLENYDAALADYDRALELDNDLSTAYLGRVSLLFRHGDYAGASETLDDASRTAARNGGPIYSIYTLKCAVRAAARIDLDQARHFCNRAAGNTGNAASALTARGFLRFVQDDLEGAAADFRRAVERDPYHAPALYGRGVVAVRQGRRAEGEADMARALEMDAFEVEFYANAGLRP